MRKTMFEMAAEIIKTQCRRNVMSPDEIISSLHVTYRTLQSLQSAEKQVAQLTDKTGEVDIIYSKNRTIPQQAYRESKP